ncbi:hypothetical protein CUMW_003270 [Citrus unshiu]|nr:hypothetical protein CUMW_003270 [Citrus unshiu]
MGFTVVLQFDDKLKHGTGHIGMTNGASGNSKADDQICACNFETSSRLCQFSSIAYILKEAMSSLPKVFASKLGIPFSNLAKPSSSRFETLIQFSTSELYSNHHCWFLEASEPDI